MKHRPKTLALLISLIGAGVAPGVQARTDLRVVRIAQPALSTEVEPTDVSALDLTRWSQGLVWRVEEGAPASNQVLHVAPELVRAYVEWAPDATPEGPLKPLAQPAPTGQHATSDATTTERTDSHLVSDVQVQEEPGTALVHPEPSEGTPWRAQIAAARGLAAADAVAQSVASDSKPRLRDRLNRIRSLIQTLGPKPKAAAPVGSAAVARPEVLAQPVVAHPTPEVASPRLPAAGTAPDKQSAATVRFADGAALPLDDDLASAHADRLMQSLAAILHEDVTSLSRDRLLSTVAARFPAAFDAPPPDAPGAARASMHRKAPAQPIERREIVVATQSDRVLRNLDAIVSSGRGETGAVVAEPEEMIVATQAEKILATLLEISTARNARDTRDARDLRRPRDKRGFAVATLSADAAALPSTPALPPLASAAHQPIDVDIDQALAHVAEPVAPLVWAAAIDASDDGNQAVAGVAAPPAPTATSTQAKPRPSPFGARELAVSESSLDRVRGGFVTENLNISFGIERAVYVNGTLVTSTSLNVSDLGRITAGRGTAAFDSGTLALIQSGAGNLVSAGSITPTSLGTVVQNTLDGQQIQNVTVINATVNSLGLLRGLNLQSSLRGAVIDSLRR